jgi:hypothetical protein
VKPRTELPWLDVGAEILRDDEDDVSIAYATVDSARLTVGEAIAVAEANSAYIVHAANLYPKLVEALRDANTALITLGAKETDRQLTLRALLRECEG